MFLEWYIQVYSLSYFMSKSVYLNVSLCFVNPVYILIYNSNEFCSHSSVQFSFSELVFCFGTRKTV